MNNYYFDKLSIPKLEEPGTSNRNKNLVGTGTSVKSPKMWAWFSRIKADRGLSRKSTSPTRILLASAPGGIFRINDKLCCGQSFIRSVPLLTLLIETLLELLRRRRAFSCPV